MKLEIIDDIIDYGRKWPWESCPCCRQRMPLKGVKGVSVEGLYIFIDGHSIKLHTQAALIAGILIKHFGRVVSHDAIISHIWGYRVPELPTQQIRTNIGRLRNAIEGSGFHVLNDEGTGYRMVSGDPALFKRRQFPRLGSIKPNGSLFKESMGNLTQDQVAIPAGVSRDVVHRIVRSGRVTVQAYVQICRVLNINPRSGAMDPLEWDAVMMGKKGVSAA